MYDYDAPAFNLREFANKLLDNEDELQMLRSENFKLKQELSNFYESQQREHDTHMQTFGNILSKALDPDSYINKQFFKK